jgi:hypothetical protein
MVRTSGRILHAAGRSLGGVGDLARRVGDLPCDIGRISPSWYGDQRTDRYWNAIVGNGGQELSAPSRR